MQFHLLDSNTAITILLGDAISFLPFMMHQSTQPEDKRTSHGLPSLPSLPMLFLRQIATIGPRVAGEVRNLWKFILVALRY